MNDDIKLRHSTQEVTAAAAVAQKQIHDLNGPSQLNKRFHCPGSARLEALCPDKPTEAATRGTELHAIVASLIHEPNQTVAIADRDAIEFVLGQYAADRIDDPAAVQATELHIDLSSYGVAGGGTVDHAWILPGERAIFHDPKFGDRPVRSPKNNWQMIGYAIGLAADYGLKEVTAVILRPQAEPEWQRMEYTFDAAALDKLGKDLQEIVEATHAVDAPLVPGKHCDDFCRAKDVCPARNALVATIPRHASFDLMISNWDPMERRSMYERSKIARQQLSALIARIEQLGTDGTCPVTGYGVKPGNETRTWMDLTTEVEATLVEICKLKSIDPALIYSKPELISPAQLEKLVGKSKPVAEKMKTIVATKTGEPKFGLLV